MENKKEKFLNILKKYKDLGALASFKIKDLSSSVQIIELVLADGILVIATMSYHSDGGASL